MSEIVRGLRDLVFTAFNDQVFALDRYTGEMAWEWECDDATLSSPAILLDGDRLIVSFNGYTYCLDPVTGSEVWKNPLKGKGTGVPVLASIHGASHSPATRPKHSGDDDSGVHVSVNT